MTRDAGYFGPDSVSWHVHREVTVLFGGARAVLMQAAHPLVIAGARETGFYERNPWKRLHRTLMLTYAITFGSKAEAHAAAGAVTGPAQRVAAMTAAAGAEGGHRAREGVAGQDQGGEASEQGQVGHQRRLLAGVEGVFESGC